MLQVQSIHVAPCRYDPSGKPDVLPRHFDQPGTSWGIPTMSDTELGVSSDGIVCHQCLIDTFDIF